MDNLEMPTAQGIENSSSAFNLNVDLHNVKKAALS